MKSPFPKPLIDANNQIAYYDLALNLSIYIKNMLTIKMQLLILENNLNTNNLNNSFNENSVFKFDIKI